MSSIGHGALKAIIENNIRLSAAEEQGIHEDKFVGDERTTFLFMQEYFLEYGQYPELRTIESEAGKSLFQSLPSEPLNYWLNQINERWMYNRLIYLRDAINDRLVADSGITEAVEVVNEIQHEIANDRSTAHSKDMHIVQTEVIEHHNRVQQMSVIPGVPFGIPFLDRIAGGSQAGDIVVVVGESSVGKCHSKGTKLLMHNGDIKEVQNVQIGDTLMGPDSKRRTILSVTSGIDNMYEIIPTVTGERWGCNSEHILTILPYSRAKTHPGLMDISVKEFLKRSPTFQKQAKLHRIAVDFEAQEVFDPYIIGLYLADGTKSSNILCCGENKIEAINYVRRVWGNIGYNKFKKGAWYLNLNGFKAIRETLRTVNNERHIPVEYLHNSRKNRLQLLAGIIDGDGYRHRDSFEIICKDVKFAEQIKYLCRSLGLSISDNSKKGTIASTGFSAEYRRLFIWGKTEDIPNIVTSKKVPITNKIRDNFNNRFTIEYKGQGVYYGFTLKEEPHYILQDFTVTHNTYMTLKFGRAAREAGYNVLMVCTEMPELQVARRDLAMKGEINANDIKLGKLSGFATDRLTQMISVSEERENSDENYYKILPGGIYSTFENIATIVKEMKPHLLIIDGAALIRSEKFRGSRWERIIEIIEKFKELALKEDHLRVILTFHYGKSGPGKQENIYGGMAISQFASMILSFEYERAEDVNNPSPVQYRNLKLIKGRDGETGIVRVLYDMRKSSITEDRVIEGNRIEDQEEEYIEEDPDPSNIVNI